MSDLIVRKIVEDRLQDNWTATKIAWDNIKYTVKAGESFIAPIINEDESESKGVNCKRRLYTVLIEIRTPKLTGTTLIASYAKQLKDLFEGYQEGNFYCIKGHTQRIGGTSTQWHQRNVILKCKYTEYIGD